MAPTPADTSTTSLWPCWHCCWRYSGPGAFRWMACSGGENRRSIRTTTGCPDLHRLCTVFTQLRAVEPCHPESMARPDTTTPPLTRPDGTPIRVLAVDDEASLTELLSMAMRYEGWQVTTAGSGGDAVKAAREVRPDAIVLDMMLPDYDGLEVMRRIPTCRSSSSRPRTRSRTGSAV